MEAWKIRRIRRKLLSYRTYKVYTRTGLLGFFDTKHAYTCKALNSIHSIERFMKYYWRKNKCRNRFDKTIYHECTSSLGDILVIDEKGFQRYYW